MQPNKKIKITYILFGLNKAFAFEWKAEHLDKEKFDLSFISIHVEANSLFEQFCRKKNIEFHRVEYQSKRNMLTAIFQTYRLLRKIKPVIVHCHIFEGSLIGLTAAWLAVMY